MQQQWHRRRQAIYMLSKTYKGGCEIELSPVFQGLIKVGLVVLVKLDRKLVSLLERIVEYTLRYRDRTLTGRAQTASEHL
jgi:hypothetical protein